MTAYYNEIDPFAAAWLRELIRAGEIAPGDVDERSIEDVTPADILGYTQCHFFAGIGVWSYALRSAGWPDDRPIWTGSCPCQPFSAAGQGKGFDDERHLWPAWFHLISVCGPELVFGEQVASKDGLAWFDLVSTDVEALGYACGAVPFPAAGVGAPHIRERLYWLAHADDARLEGWLEPGRERAAERATGARGVAGGEADHNQNGRQSASINQGDNPEHHAEPCGQFSRLADTRCQRYESWGGAGHLGRTASQEQGQVQEWQWGRNADPGHGPDYSPGPVNGIWRDADWLGCRDDRWRPVRPGSFPLAHGSAARVGRLRGYGNGLVAPQAQAFIEAYIEVIA